MATDKVTHGRADTAQDGSGRGGEKAAGEAAPPTQSLPGPQARSPDRDRAQREAVVRRAVRATAVESEPPFRPPCIRMYLGKMSPTCSWKNAYRRNETVNLRGAAASGEEVAGLLICAESLPVPTPHLSQPSPAGKRPPSKEMSVSHG